MGEKLQPVNLNGLEFDALLSFERGYESSVPEYPVEDGYSVGDTIILKPMVINITAILSAAPVTFRRSHGVGRERVEKMAKQLEALYERRTLLTLSTSKGIYKDMAIESMSLPYSADTKTSMHVSFKLKKIYKAGSKTVSIPESYGKSGETGVNAGTANTAPMTSNTSGSGADQQKADSKKASSALHGLMKGFW